MNIRKCFTMDKNKLILNAAVVSMLAAAMLSASVLTGCGNGSDTKETKVVTETQIVTRVVTKTGAATEGTEAKSGQETTAAAEKKETEKKETEKKENSGGESQNNGSNNNGESNNSSGGENDNRISGKSEGENKGSGGSLVKNPTPNLDSNSTKNEVADNSGYKSDNKTLKIDGKEYKVGDKVTIVYYLSYPSKFINYQGFIDYDGKCLKPVEFEMLGSASSGCINNIDENLQRLYFNGSRLAGYHYENGGEFMYVTFEVVGGGEASPKQYWEVASDMDGNSILNDPKLVLTYSYQ